MVPVVCSDAAAPPHPSVSANILTLSAVVVSEYPSASPSCRSCSMSSVMVTAASTMCTTMSCMYALSSALSLLVARPSAAPSKLEMAALLCLGVSRVPSVDEKSIRPLATCEAIICRSTQSPTESMSFVIATESVSTEASAAAQAKLPSASLDSHAD